MISNDAIFARFNKIEAAKASFAAEARKVELALVDDAKQMVDTINEYISTEQDLAKRFDGLRELLSQFEDEAVSVFMAYDNLRVDLKGEFTAAQRILTELESAAEAIGIEPSELSAYDELNVAVLPFSEVVDKANTILDDNIFSYLR
jgi:hypothetical protein